MAYSDYGGYAYRNGIRIVERSDATITPDGDTFGTPGIYPGFGMLAAGLDADEVKKRIQWPHGHAVLGDCPIYVALYKQSSLSIYRLNERLDLLDLAGEKYPGAVTSWEYKGETQTYFDTEGFDDDNPLVIEFDGYRIEAVFLYQDNYYMYVKLVQPDGVMWHGWSGYGVGAGFDGDYGYSNSDRDSTLKCLWPESIAD